MLGAFRISLQCDILIFTFGSQKHLHRFEVQEGVRVCPWLKALSERIL